MRRPRGFWVALMVLIAAGAVSASVVWALQPAQPGLPAGPVGGLRPGQVGLVMVPVHPPAEAVCVGQVRQYGYSLDAAASVCGNGEGASWYYARLTNDGRYALMNCRASGYDTAGKVVFRGPLPLTFGGLRGWFAQAHHAVMFYWFLPEATASPVARYAASCSASNCPWS